MRWLAVPRRAWARLAERAAAVRPYLPPVNFITLHYAYFVLSCLVFALVFWAAGSPASRDIGFLDSLFLATSALTATGLNTANLSDMSSAQQAVLFLAMMLGHPVLVSLWAVLFRRHVFEKRFRAIVRAERERKLGVGLSGLVGMARLRTPARSTSRGAAAPPPGLGTRIPGTPGPGRDPEAALAPIPEGRPARTFLDEKRRRVGRNGGFANLTLREREYLGGVEYRAVEVLIVTVAAYYVLWQLLGSLALGAWLAARAPEIPAADRQSPWWAGVFLGVSAFANGGLTLFDAGMTAFQTGYYFVLVVVLVLTLAGSQASPIFLRLIVWLLSRLLRASTRGEHYAVWKETFDFILRYPRRVYINMFPARATWMLALWLGAFLAVDWAMFFALNRGNDAIERIPLGPRVVDGLFQSVSTLSGGFAVVSVSDVYFGLQVLWLVKMYASAYPTSVTVRGSNVYEERSLGIYAGDEPADKTGALPETPMTAASRLSSASRGVDRLVGLGREGTALLGRHLQRRMTGFHGVGVAPRQRRAALAPTPASPGSTARPAPAPAPAPDLVSHHVRSQLSHDMWWIALAFFVVAVVETPHTLADPAAYSLFNMLFEIVSAYANNGVSIGLPGAAHSFSGGWRPASKLVLVLVMLRGRHRDLPVALDRAVKLPSIDLDEEDDDAVIRRALSRSPRPGSPAPLIPPFPDL